MHTININNDLLEKALKKTKEIVLKKPTIESIRNVLFRVKGATLVIVATDLEVTIISELPCECDTLEPLDFLLPFDFLAKFSSLNNGGSLCIKADKTGAILKGFNDVCQLNSLDSVDDFPQIPALPVEHFLKINNDFIHWLNKAMETVSEDTLRPAMTKVCLDVYNEGMTMVSTNARCLFSKRFNITSKKADRLLVSAKQAKSLKDFTETEIFWNDNHLAFKSENVTVIATRPDTPYPDYKAVIPSYKSNIEFNRNELVLALEKAALCSETAAPGVKFMLRSKIGLITVVAEDLNFNRHMEVELPVDYYGECDIVTINPNTMLKLLGQVEYDKISMAIEKENSAIVLRAESDQTYEALIMPIVSTN